MLITLFAWMYISLICHSWGLIFLKAINKINGSHQPPAYGFSITNCIGLAAIGGLVQIISLFSGLGNIFLQVLLFLPAVYVSFFFEKPRQLAQRFRAFIQNTSPAVLFLLAGTLLMILVMSVYAIVHPDTVAYHIQSIKWAEKYPAIPGLANINFLYGFQNTWFLLCGLFSFSFTGANALTFINTTVLMWLLIFLAQKINEAIKKHGNYYTAFLWLLFLFINLWTYTQIRLTATSASPDFVAAIYVLLTFYLFIQSGKFLKEAFLLITYLCFFTLTVKLSALPLILPALYLQYPFNGRKIAGFLSILFIVFVPFIIRNIIISGYLLFPSSFVDIINADWKYDSSKLDHINNLILAFARTHGDITITDLPFTYWIRQWWQYLYAADKLVIAVQFFSIAVLVINYKKITAANKLKTVAIFVSLIGLFFWFLKAPDPRFGAGFLLLFPSLILCSGPFGGKTVRLFTSANIVVILCLLLGVSVSCYSAYRFIRYLKRSEIILPEGFVMPYKSVYYKEIKTCIPLFEAGNKNVTMVADSGGAKGFNFRGTKVQQGFRNKN